MITKDYDNKIAAIETKLDLLLGLLQSGVIFPQKADCRYSLFAWLEEWYKVYKLPKLKHGSIKQIRNCIDNHIKPNIKISSLMKLWD